jgi:hypothetical protein
MRLLAIFTFGFALTGLASAGRAADSACTTFDPRAR